MIYKILRSIYLSYFKLKARHKLKVFRASGFIGQDVTVGPDSNAIVEKGGKLVIGDHCEIIGTISVKSGASVTIGHHTTTRGADIGALQSISIGNYVIISNTVTIYDNNNHPTSEIARKAMSESGFHSPLWNWEHSASAPIVIEDNVWIGQRAVILKGVTIGRGSIVAMDSVVTKSVPPHSIVAGNPARVVKTIPENERITE